jgi:uncharacterized membrane-anchored protein
MSKSVVLVALLALTAIGAVRARSPDEAKTAEFRAKLRALDWVLGPREIAMGGNSSLSLPDGYVYLDAANTTKFEELNENLSGGNEVLVAPKSLRWVAYLLFEDAGYVKDTEKIDADAILKTLKDSTEASNQERKRRGWPDLHVVGWSIPPAYNATTKRLEWATLLQSQGNEGTNFFTKVLGRRGFTTVILVSSPQNSTAAVADLNRVLAGYQFKSGETYADWRPGDKVAEYGLAGLIVGGAVAAAVKTGLLKGLWKFLVTAVVAMWKVIVVAAAAVVAGVKSFFKRRRLAS